MIWLATLLCIGLCAAVAPAEGQRRCLVCGRPARPRYKYCPVCWEFCCNREHAVPVAERIRALRQALDQRTGRFRCYYTGAWLDVEDPNSPFYLTFDHIDPRGKRVVVCAKFLNDMKKDLTGDEFRKVVPALSDHLEKGIPFDPNIIDFVCWPRRFDVPRRMPMTRTPPSPKGCKVCQMKRRPYSLYCNRCRYFIWHKKEHVARSEAMAGGWDIVLQGFICKYSGLLLDYLNRTSPWYMTFDHRFPGKKGFMVVCAAWVNYMKTYLTDEQFRVVLKALADHFRDGTPFDTGVLDVRSYKAARKGLKV
jgi:hypothetical protein